MAEKYLVTSALPYVNGDLHLGHLVGCWLPSDIYARFCRACGRDVLHICGADEHGTPVEVGAMLTGMTPVDYSNLYYEKHLKTVRDFNLAFDIYGRTHTKKHEVLVQSLFSRLDELGLIEERETLQPFCVDDNMFLADRQLVGTCPKCGYEKARGDQCDNCSATYEATELLNPRSTISGSTNIEKRATKNLFFLASKAQKLWEDWLDTHSADWSKTAKSIARGWQKEGLRDYSITRDLSWGIPVNKPGYENKVFYVWFDAPWGYVSISQSIRDNWEDWWKNPDCHYAQFMGKDNVKFHAVLFPEQQLALQDNWKTVDQLKAMNFLNFEGGKFSKSEKRGIFLDQALEIAPADVWRYALIASAPETDDTDFTFTRFADIVNKDLNGMLGNFVSRVCKITDKNFGNLVPNGSLDSELAAKVNEKIAELTAALDACEFRNAVFALRSLYAIGNEYMTVKEPWVLVKNGDLESAGQVLNNCFQLIDLYSRVSAPFIPATADKIKAVFVAEHDLSWPEKFEARIQNGEEFSVPENLFSRIDDETVAALTEKFVPKVEEKVPSLLTAKIVSVKEHPTNEKLHILTVDDGTNHELQIVCGAPNVRTGLVSVLAPIGSRLPNAKKPISQRTVAGVESFGMLCSSAEIGQGTDGDNIIELDGNTEIGQEYLK